MSVSRHHADWLSLVESSGPFLSLPVLLRAFPQGLDPRDPEQAKQLRLAYEEWQENPNLAAKQRAWVTHVLTQVLLHPKDLLAEGQTLPPGLTATMAEYGEILRPELALLGPVGSELAAKPQLLISLYPVEQSLDKPAAGKHWKATPGTRMMELLHATDVPLGLVTNGEEWMLVFAPRGDTTGFTSWYASLWIDEPITLRAFHSLLSTRRFFGVAPSDTLVALLKESAQDQQEVTNQLGDQVRDAVEVLIQAFDRLDQDTGRTLLKGLDEKSLYDAALTVMMRLVFLFSAEERGLLHLGEPLYDENYAVSTLREQLQEVADHYGEEVLERRHDGWARLLATFRAVHGGVNHQDLMLPAYGGSLFDPDRYPFLEGRAPSTRWQSSPAAPLEINNRVVLHLLKSLQMLQVKVPGGGPAEALRVSFEGLNIEQIGHVYEGLLDHTAVRAKEVVLGLAASRKKPVASIALAELEKLRQDDEAKLIELLEEETGRSGKALEKALKNGGEPEDFHKLLVACGQDKEVAERIIPFRGLLRQDSFDRLVVVLPGGIYVGQGGARRSTGTHYTPRSLTEPIVQHTLEPLVYQGPAEGLPKEQWWLRSPKEILELKVCDMAMGSGAFLVQACRYLSERLVEAWENLEKEHPGEVLITPEGGFSQGEPSERLIPEEAAERLAIARRLVADRCLYGVDINPMAVEMAKLSIWLITVDKSRPFTFLDHALKCGDSLLGAISLQQIENFSLRAGEHQITFSTSNLFRYAEEASLKRIALEALPSDSDGQIVTKNRLHSEAEAATAKVRALADCIVALELCRLDGKAYDQQRSIAADTAEQAMHQSLTEFQSYAQERLGERRAFHWPLEFPEVFQRGGFQAIVGNPPFMGGRLIGRALGDEYHDFLAEIRNRIAGSPDLCAYFILRAFSMLALRGYLGMLATKTIAETGTRSVCLDQLIQKKATIFRASARYPWPGAAAVVVAVLHIAKSTWHARPILDGEELDLIDGGLQKNAGDAAAFQLVAMKARFSQGQDLMGRGFELDEKTRSELIRVDPSSASVIRPLFNGQDLNTMARWVPYRWAIYFADMSESEARRFPAAFDHLKTHVKPYREGLTGQIHQTCFWKFWDLRPKLMAELQTHQEILASAVVTKYVSFRRVPTSNVYNHKTKLYFFYRWFEFAVLQSSLHQEWAHWRCATLGATTFSYSTSAALETWPMPEQPGEDTLDRLGQHYHQRREEIMKARDEGLTSTYNRFHDVNERSSETQNLRDCHSEMDRAVAAAYGWNDVDLGHTFSETRQGMRLTICEIARRTILDRLLALNHQRHEEEVRAGLHEKKARRGPARARSEITSAQRELL